MARTFILRGNLKEASGKLGLTYRNFMHGILLWLRMLNKSKSNSYSEWLV